jgi:predicted ABC-type ATPase
LPRALIIAGPNGAGKTTFAREFLPNEGGIEKFLNADLIAAGLSPFGHLGGDVEAGRILRQRLDTVVAAQSDFAIETTLSGKWLVNRMPALREVGYYIELHYLRLSEPSIAIERVRRRVLEGGHDVPIDTIRRRFNRSLDLFNNVFKERVDYWVLYDVDGAEPEILDYKGMK